MNSIIVFTEGDQWRPDKWAKDVGVCSEKSGRIVVGDTESWVGIERCEDTFEDYELEEEVVVRSFLTSPVAYLVEWRGERVISALIEDLQEFGKVVIDNDHGVICEVSEVANLSINSWILEDSLP